MNPAVSSVRGRLPCLALHVPAGAAARLVAFLAALLQLHTVLAQETKPVPIEVPAVSVRERKPAGAVDFEKEILPVFKNNCLACHNQTKAKADLILETPQTILKGGESGPAVVPGKSTESLLLKLASHQEKPNMPPKDNKVNALDLTPEQLALVRLWIDQGALGEVHGAVPIEWRSLPEGMNPIFAVAVTPDGQFAACARANQIFIYHIPSGQLATRLSDPQLDEQVQTSEPKSSRLEGLDSKLTGVAHRDLVHSLAFSPDGNLLASGGYREVKLWRRPRNAHRQLPMAGWQLSNEKISTPPSTEPASNEANPSPPQAIAISIDGKWLATGGPNGAIALWDIASGKKAKDCETSGPPEQDRAVTGLKFSPDGTRLCSSGAGHTLRIWAVPEGALVAQSNLEAEIGEMTWINSADSTLATSGADKLIHIWQVVEGTNSSLKLIRSLPGREGVVTCLDIVPAGKECAGFYSELWTNPFTANSPRKFAPLLPAPMFLLAGGADGSVRLWNLQTGQMVLEMGHGEPVSSVAVRPDGKCFASAGLNNKAKLWKAEDGTLLAEMKGDRYAQEFVVETERTFSVATNEVAYCKNALSEADKQQKASTERLGKATETFTAADHTFNEKQKVLEGATQSRATADKALADLNSELKQVTEDYQTAEKTATQAASEAKAALERATHAKLLADQATQTKIETERIALDAAGVASRSKAAAGANLAESVKAAAGKMAAGAADVAEKAQAFAESAAGDAAAKAKAANEAKTAAEKAIDEVAAKSFAVGQMKPRFDTVTSENPAKLKKAAEKISAATNTLAEVEKEFKKAEQIKSTADQELKLAKTAAQQAADTVAQTKKAVELAEGERTKAETEAQRARKIALDSEKPLRTLAFSPDNMVLATAGDDHKVHTWSAETGAAFETFNPDPMSDPRPPLQSGPRPPQAGNSNTILALTFTGHNALLSASLPEGLTSWDLNPAWTLEQTLGSGAADSLLVDRVNAIRFSPDGQWLASGGGEPSRGGEIILWKVGEGRMEKEFRNAHSDTVLALDFSPNGKYLASGAADKFVKVIDLASGKVVKSFEGHLHHVLGVSWKRDGRTLASSGADNVVKVWDFLSGERKKNIEGFNKEVTSVAFIDGTDQALTSSGDNQVRLLRENGDSVRSFSGATDYVYSAMATPDGKIVIAGGQDSMLRVWNGLDGKPITIFPPPAGK